MDDVRRVRRREGKGRRKMRLLGERKLNDSETKIAMGGGGARRTNMQDSGEG